ncbi:PQQ-dependent sugar dehydrogenase [Georgenia sp. TF02-10]|uniref:PQQ-dependent sugar dehydrogenase n=1 Tax=Georgenia sp. TF02-10 TaxID=2917725 RepID=UPI001FA718E4|nr:PQQ-dependent sugar dehydrogenase [Georgenia sp. TF02-10]UNX54798.1 PQQ-dependent sugar dehydrogenase [Georgenia sp. TF02-10]
MRRAAAVVVLMLLVGACGEPAGPGGDGAGTPSPAAPSPSAAPTSADAPTSPGAAPAGEPTTPAPGPSTTPAPGPGTPSPTAAGSAFPLGEVATDLDVPWGLALRADGSALLTLRDRGEVLRLRPGAAPASLGRVPGVAAQGEGGLLGIAVDPADDTRVFVYLTTEQDNRVLRLRLDGDRLVPDAVVLSAIPRAGNHNGGRLAFGPDGFLYVTTGDAGDPARSQDRASLAGKILRVDADGRPAPGNPDPGSPVWSLGHRNVQGIAWDARGRLWASELGQDRWDELNLIEPGGNYGWPEVEGAAGREGFVDPVQQWATADASPSGIAVTGGAAYLAALRGNALWRVPLDGGEPDRLLAGEYGRLRTVAADAAGRLWLVTSNTFRGQVRPGDDRVVVLDPATLR